MKFSILALSIAFAHAFVPAPGRMGAVKPLKQMSDEIGIPCEDECALESFPNLPASVHPGVLSGQAMMDLLNHAKENGTYDILERSFSIPARPKDHGEVLPTNSSSSCSASSVVRLDLSLHRLRHPCRQLRF